MRDGTGRPEGTPGTAAGDDTPGAPAKASAPFRLSILPDGDVRFLSAGDAFQELVGVSAATVLQDPAVLWDRLEPEVRPSLRASLDGAARSLEPWFAEFRLATPGGSPRWYRVAARPLRDSTGCVTFTGVVLDVTEGKRLDDALGRDGEGAGPAGSEAEGEGALPRIADQLGQALGADAVVLASVDDPEARSLTVVGAWFADPGRAPPTDDLSAGPLREVARSGARTWPSGLCDRFARDAFGTALEAVAFAGLPLVDEQGRALGALGAWFRRNLEGLAPTESTLSVFARRATAVLQRRRWEGDRRRTATLLRAIVDNTSALVFVKDLAGHYLLVNREWCQVFDTTPEESLGRTDHDLFPPALADVYRENDRYMLELGRETVTEEETIAGGERRTYISVKFPLHDEAGRVVATGGIATDITDRKRTERALAEERTFVTAVLDLTGSLVVALDGDGCISRLNGAFERVLGWTAAEARGRTLEEVLLPWEGDDRVARTFRHLIRGGEAHRYEGDFRARDGTLRRIAWTGAAIRDEEGRLRWVVGTGQDVTERHRLETALAQAQRLESLGRLAGGIAHDFNNLLTPVLGYVDLLLAEMPPGDPRSERLRQVQEASHRAHALTRQLLAFGRGQVIDRREVHLGHVMESFGRILRRTIREDIRIETRVEPELGPVMADPTQIEQILLNLALNAQDALPGGGTLTLEAGNVRFDEPWSPGGGEALPAGPYVCLTVSDDGAGMDEEVQRRIFEPFFSTKAVGHGTGLGLATVYGIVRQLEGRVEVHSLRGHGTTFQIHLPRSAGGLPAAVETPVAGPAPRGTESVLVVEDNGMVRDLAVDVLRSHGYAVRGAATPEEGLALLGSPAFRAELLVSDLVMPGLDGRALFQRAREVRPDLRVLYMSGYADHVVARYGLLEPGTFFLAKPFAAGALARSVRQALDAPVPGLEDPGSP